MDVGLGTKKEKKDINVIECDEPSAGGGRFTSARDPFRSRSQMPGDQI